jgi:SAM-dependent methyltransferase
MIDLAKEIDWNEVWKAQMQLSRESGSGRECARIWESRESAERFWSMSEDNKDRVDRTIWGTDITPESRILDIGAGPGTLAIPFALKVAHVTAVEPAEGMVSVLKEKAAKFRIQNISVVKKHWEDVNIKADLEPPYDVVIASFSLGMQDIRSAIQEMVEASSRYVYLYHFAGPTSWDLLWREIWPKLHGKEYRPGPKCDVLYNILYQMGIYPYIHPFRLEHTQRFSSMQQALDNLRHQARAETDEQMKVLRDYLGRIMREENGMMVLPGSSIRVKIWWDKQF